MTHSLSRTSALLDRSTPEGNFLRARAALYEREGYDDAALMFAEAAAQIDSHFGRGDLPVDTTDHGSVSNDSSKGRRMLALAPRPWRIHCAGCGASIDAPKMLWHRLKCEARR